jgi:hypothetical protein
MREKMVLIVLSHLIGPSGVILGKLQRIIIYNPILLGGRSIESSCQRIIRV